MYLGAIVEMVPKEELYTNPLHPYTRALLASVPKMPRDGERQRRFSALKGEVFSPIDLLQGYRFQSRCEYVMETCRKQEPAFREVSPGHFVACHLV